MTFKDLAKKLNASVQTVPNLINVLADAFDKMEGGSSIINYSTDEQEVGTWDDKKLYMKVVKSTTTPTAGTWNTIALPANISVKMFDAYYERTTGAVDKFSTYRSGSSAESLTCSVNGSSALYSVSSQFVSNFSEFRIIIYYTKNA